MKLTCSKHDSVSNKGSEDDTIQAQCGVFMGIGLSPDLQQEDIDEVNV